MSWVHTLLFILPDRRRPTTSCVGPTPACPESTDPSLQPRSSLPTGARCSARPRAAAHPQTGRGSAGFETAGKHKVVIRLTRQGKLLLRRSKRLKLKSKAQFTPSGGRAVTIVKIVHAHAPGGLLPGRPGAYVVAPAAATPWRSWQPGAGSAIVVSPSHRSAGTDRRALRPRWSEPQRGASHTTSTDVTRAAGVACLGENPRRPGRGASSRGRKLAQNRWRRRRELIRILVEPDSAGRRFVGAMDRVLSDRT